GRWDRLDEAEGLLGVHHVGLVRFAVSGWEFQCVTFCNGLIALVYKSLLEGTPISLSMFGIVFEQFSNDVHDAVIPFAVVPDFANLFRVNLGQIIVRN